ncbi:PliI family lysozyme inhibitor of I-type lysozyme [Shewanella sp. Isolate8]|uniref:PliI family lysozyme inhibitor of I-type lysozyme n=1 Tax=Shewanella sp. Isolate8 TaxID=2908529 RepID=UPI001EFD5E91|nr:PliI family lysozyme inhibitor of I-type lysozyme [Shewanella sp. Isolate8]MCG9746073.1 PliI family lysozyme inhibitor of I-type lysozyme [Shewanella sp. Isolate8]
MLKPLLTAALVMSLSACMVNIEKSPKSSTQASNQSSTHSSTHSSTSQAAASEPESAGASSVSSDSYAKAFTLANGYSLVVVEGALEPRSIGSVQVSLYRNLDVGDFAASLAFVRDGTILKAELVDNSQKQQKLVVTIVTAGSGNYQSTQAVCVAGESLTLCQ